MEKSESFKITNDVIEDCLRECLEKDVRPKKESPEDISSKHRKE